MFGGLFALLLTVAVILVAGHLSGKDYGRKGLVGVSLKMPVIY